MHGCGDRIGGGSCGGCATLRAVLEVPELHAISEFCPDCVMLSGLDCVWSG